MKTKIVVVGAGVIGLSTAYNILQTLPDTEVTIVADTFSPNTTSDAAAGFVYPYLPGATPASLLRRWTVKTIELLEKLYWGPSGNQTGISLISGHIIKKDIKEEITMDCGDILYGLREMTQDELRMYPGYAKGVTFSTYMCEGYKFLPWLMDQIQNLGGQIVNRSIRNLQELYRDYDVVVNCSGLRSVDLTGDRDTIPVRGQICRVRAPWVRHFILDEEFYILPGMEYVVLGGTHTENDWNTTPNAVDKRRIMDGCCNLVPSLRNAQLVKDQAGLRPMRATVPIKLEAETVRHGNKTINIVHNYGHGGSGMTVYWGCALDATDLVRTAIHNTKSKL